MIGVNNVRMVHESSLQTAAQILIRGDHTIACDVVTVA